jgi:hypothetical protein
VRKRRIFSPPALTLRHVIMLARCAAQGWCDKSYIYTAGYHSRLLFRSSMHSSGPDARCVHDCYIIAGGEFAPRPTFRIVASDRPHEPIDAASTSACIRTVQKRINAALGKEPKTASSGPQVFGLRARECVEGIEELDASRLCTAYWAAKGAAADGAAGGRKRRRRLSGVARRAAAVAAAAAAGGAAGGAAGTKRKRVVTSDDEEGDDDEDGDGSEDGELSSS